MSDAMPDVARLDDELLNLLLSTSELSARHMEVCQKIRQHIHEINVLLAEHSAAVIKHVNYVNNFVRTRQQQQQQQKTGDSK